MFYCKNCYVTLDKEREQRQGKDVEIQSKCRSQCDPMLRADELPFRRLLREIKEASKEASLELRPYFTNVDVQGKAD
jgi:hypothetical protein